MFAKACSKHWKSSSAQSSTFVSSGLKPAATDPPPVALRVSFETNSATWSICSFDSLSWNDGMPTPPFRTWRATRTFSGFRSSRLGPVVPVASAASIVWQLPQPASANTFAPGELAAESEPPSPSPFPPQPTTPRRTTPTTSAVRTLAAATHDIQAQAPP